MKKYPFIFLFILIFCNTIAGQVPDSLKYHLLPPAEFKQEYERESYAHLVDVREFFEYRRSRIKGAINIPSSSNLEFVTDTIDRVSALYLYCTSDFRSNRVAKKLYDIGFRNLYSLEGGIVAWRKAGFAVSRKKVKR